MSIDTAVTSKPATAAKPANGTTPKVRKAPERRERSEVEAVTSKCMNLIGRLPESGQRKVIAAVAALTAKED